MRLKSIIKYCLLFLMVFKGVYSFGQLRINEFQATNITVIDTSTGNYSDWIEIYNDSDVSINLQGYYLSDNVDLPLKWMISDPIEISSKGYVLFWADKIDQGNHTNFGLSSNGESIVLSSPEGSVIDQLNYSEQSSDLSMGCSLQNAREYLFFETPTPGEINSSIGKMESIRSSQPTFSVQPGFYSSAISLNISGSGTVYYTTDGSVPNEKSLVYTSSISISKTSIIRAVNIEKDHLSSDVLTGSYLFDIDNGIPVISLVIEEELFSGEQNGLYAYGDAVDWKTANFSQDWERPVNVEYYEDGELKVNQLAGLAINGALRDMPNKSLRLFARGKYGNNSFEHQFFEGIPLTEFSSLVLRNGGAPDFRYSGFRDGFMTDIPRGEMDIDLQGHVPCNLFINGEYWGIYNVREKQNEDYLEAHHGVDPNNVDMVQNYGEVIEGSNTDFFAMKKFVTNNDMKIQENHDYYTSLIDVDEFTNYQMAQIYYGNQDWPGNNIKFWKQITPNGKWRWIMFDVDVGFGTPGWPEAEWNSLEHTLDSTSTHWFNFPGATVYLRALLKNEDYKNNFIQTFAVRLNTTFSPERVDSLFYFFKNRIEPYVELHSERWKDSGAEFTHGVPFKTKAEWESQSQLIKDFYTEKPDYLRSQIKEYFGLSGISKLTLNSYPGNGGTFVINKVSLEKSQLQGEYFNDVPLEIKTIPNPGFRFAGWAEKPLVTIDSLSLTLSGDFDLTAKFIETDETKLPNRIVENTTLSVQNSPFYTSGDLIVDSNVVLTIDPGVEIIMAKNSSVIVYGKVDANGTENEPIVFKNNERSAMDTWGSIIFWATTDTSEVDYVKLINATSSDYNLDFKAAISLLNGQAKFNHIDLTEVIENPLFGRFSDVRLSNSIIHSRITGDLVNIKQGYCEIDGCEFIGNSQVDTDAIDYDGINGGTIKNSIIHSFYGGNSDGIDLGEGSTNIVIENNLIYDCTDKGVSIGQASDGILSHNVIINCNQGVGIKDLGSYAKIDYMTFYGNQYGVAAFEKNIGNGAGKADVSNTIFAHSSFSDVFTDNLGVVNTTYSLSDNLLIQGEFNIVGDPLFRNSKFGDLSLLINSPAIDKADPEASFDEDGSRSDIGAKYFFKEVGETIVPLQINEVMTNNSYTYKDNEGKYSDWVEIYNPNDFPIDLAGYYLTDDSTLQVIHEVLSTDLSSTNVPANGFRIVWVDGDSTERANHLNFKLSALGENVYLLEKTKTIVDQYRIPAVSSDQSYGRIKENSDLLNVLVTPTPNAVNYHPETKIVSVPKTIGFSGKGYYYKVKLDMDVNNHFVELKKAPSWLTLNEDFEITGDVPIDFLGVEEIEVIVKDLTIGESVSQIYELHIVDFDSLTSIAKKKTEILDEYYVYPNPVTDKVVLNIPSGSTFQSVSVNSLKGDEINIYFNSEDSNGSENQITVDVSVLEPGIYLLKTVLGNGEVFVERIMKGD